MNNNFYGSTYTVNGKVYRNLEAQVLENQKNSLDNRESIKEIYKPVKTESKLELTDSDFSKYQYFGGAAKNWFTSLESIMIQVAFKNGTTVNFTSANGGITLVDKEITYLNAVAYTVSGDRKIYVAFNQKVNITGRFTIALAPAGILSEQGVLVNDFTVAFDNSVYNLADIRKNGYNGVTQQVILWDDHVMGITGETLPKENKAVVWGETHDTYIFSYQGDLAAVPSNPFVPTIYHNALLSVASGNFYIGTGKNYLIQNILNAYGVDTQNTYLVATEAAASQVNAVLIFVGSSHQQTFTASNIVSTFLGAQGTPSFDWLTSPQDVYLEVNNLVIQDLTVNGFDKENNIVSAYSPQLSFISGVDGLTGKGFKNQYSVILNPQLSGVTKVNIGKGTWRKIPYESLDLAYEVNDTYKPVASKAVKDYIDQKTQELLQYLGG